MTEETVNESLKKVARGTTFAFFGLFVYLFLEFITRAIIARNATQSEYGVFSIGFVLLNFFVIASCLGLQSGTPRYIAYFRGKDDDEKVKGVIASTIRLSFIASLFCFLLFFFSSDFLTALFHLQQSSILKIFALAVPFFVAIEILASIFLGFDRVHEKVYFRDVLMNMLKVSFIALVIVLGHSFLEMIYAYLLSIVIAAIAFIIYAVKKLSLKNISADSVTKELLLFSIPLLISCVLSIIILQMDTLMLGYFKTAAIVGLYNAACPISLLILLFPKSLDFIYVPIISQLYSKSLMGEIRRNYAILTKWVFSATFPIFLIIFLFPEAVLNVFFGSAYVQASVVLTLQILALGMFTCVLLGPNAATLIIIGKTKLNMIDDLVGAITNVSLNIFLIPTLGIVGAAIASVISLSFINMLKSVQIFRIHKIHPFTMNYLKPGVTSTLLIFVIYMLAKHLFSTSITIWMLILLLFLFLAVYGVCLLITRSFDKEDVMMIQEMEKILGTNANLSYLRRILRRFM
jgi:O-antigen/teichoic acid export membrane protein